MNVPTDFSSGRFVITDITSQALHDQVKSFLQRRVKWNRITPFDTHISTNNMRLENGAVMGFGSSSYVQGRVDNEYGSGHVFITAQDLLSQSAEGTQWIAFSERKPTQQDAADGARFYMWNKRGGSITPLDIGSAVAHSPQNFPEFTHWMRVLPPPKPALEPIVIDRFHCDNGGTTRDATIAADGQTVTVGCWERLSFEKVKQVYDAMVKRQEEIRSAN